MVFKKCIKWITVSEKQRVGYIEARNTIVTNSITVRTVLSERYLFLNYGQQK